MAWRAPKQSRGAKLVASFLGGAMCIFIGWVVQFKVEATNIGLLLYLWGGWMLFQGICIAAAPGLVYWYVRRREEPDRQRVGRRRRRELVQGFWQKHAPALAVLKFVYGGFMFTAMGGSLYLGFWLAKSGSGGYKLISIWAAPFIAFGLGFFVCAYVKYRALSADAGGEESQQTGPAPEPPAEIPEIEEEPAPQRPQSFPLEHTCPQCGETFTIRKSGRYKCKCGRAFSL